MKTVSIIYYSTAGHTARFAEAVAAGVRTVAEVQVQLIAIAGDDIVKGRFQNEAVMAQLDASDAIIFGSPTYMGGAAAQFKAFADASSDRWYGQQWADKIAAGFTVSGALSGDKYHTLQYMQALAMQHGMIWVGLGELPAQENGVNRLGSWIGAMGLSGHEPTDDTPNAEDLKTAEVLGGRVATVTARFN